MHNDLAMLADAQTVTARIVKGVRPDQYDDPSPCREMDVRSLLNHIVTGTEYFASVVDGEPYDGAAAPDCTEGDPAVAYAAAAERTRQAWSAPGVLDRDYDLPFGRLPASVAIGTTVLETVVHGWDLARATGQSFDLDPAIPEQLLRNAQAMLPPDGRGAGVPFDDAVPVASDAPPVDQLVAYLGRRP